MEKKPKEKSKYFILAFLEFPQKQVEINIESHLFNFSFFFSFKFKAASYLNITLTPAFRVGPNIFRAKHAARDGRQGLSHFGNQTRNQFLTLQQPQWVIAAPISFPSLHAQKGWDSGRAKGEVSFFLLPPGSPIPNTFQVQNDKTTRDT